MSLPTGTVTFLFTDIEGSTKLWEQYPEAMRDALAWHNRLMHQAIATHGGFVFKTMGDAFCAAFASAPAALVAALDAQQSLQSEPWSEEVTLRVRMALHTGLADEHDGDYFGPTLNRVARLLSTGHGGQTLLSRPAYELTRDVLPSACTVQDLGAHSLRDLARPEQVYQLCHPDLPSEFPPLKSLDSLPNNLPVQLTSFVGREKELSVVKALLARTKLLTLTGSGGCGKTRLSLQTAADVLEIFPDGVWLTELAPIADPNLVPQAVANVLGIKEQTGKTYTQMLTEHLKAKTLLLVLDNCEHVLTACAGLADTLLRSCPSLKVLASSREGLGIAGETVYRIPSLSLPDPKQKATPESLSQYEAVQLFLDRATAALSSFIITNANAPALASVCHRVDGIPLAIELAAARVRSLAVEEINARLDNRFRLLTGGSRTALPRQQTLRALIDWSYDLLTEPEKSLLCRLSVFAGGWTLAAAEVIGVGEEIEEWEVVDLLTSLVDKSLVPFEEANGQTRYRLLETVRQYARDRLAEGDTGVRVREKHRDYFLRLAEEIKPKLNGPEQAKWLSVLETEHDNLRQAITYCLEEPEGAKPGLRLGGALAQFWWTRGHLSEGRERLTLLLTRPEAQALPNERSAALNSAGVLARMQGDNAEALALMQECLTIRRALGDPSGIAASLVNLGNLARRQGDYAGARTLYGESLAIRRELGDRRGIVDALTGLGIVAAIQGDYAPAQSLFAECLTVYRELGDQSGTANALLNLGNIAEILADYPAARSHLGECLVIRRQLGDRRGIGDCLIGLGNVAQSLGDYAEARALQEECVTICRELGDQYGIASSLNGLGNAAQAQADSVAAQAMYAEGLAISRNLDDKSGIALALSNLGAVAASQGDGALVRVLSTESLEIFRDLEDRNNIARLLEAFAALALSEEKTGHSVRLFGAAEALREVLGTLVPANEREENHRQVAAAREMLGDEAFATAWAAGRAMPMEQAVECALAEE